MAIVTFKQSQKDAGFTLIEMVIYVASLLLVIGAVSSILVWMARTSSEVQVRNELVAGLEHALSLMGNEIREAQSIYTPTTSSTQLSLDTRNNVPVGEVSTYVDFFLCGTRLCIKREFQAPQSLTADRLEIQSVAFTHVQTGGASSVHVVVTAARGNATQEARTTFSLRSYQ